MTAGDRPDRRALADALHSAAIRLLRELRREDRAMGQSPARASVLSILAFRGEQRMSALAELEQVARPTMTKLVAGLARDGLVQLRDDPADGRAVRVRATARGSRLLQSGRRRRVERLASLLAPLNDRQAAQLDAAVGLLRERLAAGADERAAERAGGGRSPPGSVAPPWSPPTSPTS
ncbi:MAG: MarR family transcriptional regulator [Planctomycetes bacterium]|nr:MarR family transcriptional regulator [Planctomycetota bacterium]